MPEGWEAPYSEQVAAVVAAQPVLAHFQAWFEPGSPDGLQASVE